MARSIQLLVCLMLSVSFAVAVRGAEDDPQPQREIYTVLAYGDGIFEPDLWLANAAESRNRTIAEWRSDALGGQAYIDYLHFGHDTTPDEALAILDDDWFKGTLSNYEAWQIGETCQLGDELMLFELRLDNDGIKYRMRYWAEYINGTRMLTAFLVFPVSGDELDEYAERWFPEFSSCEAE